MKTRISLGLFALVAGCGGGTQFTTVGVGPISTGVECVAKEITEAGWRVASRNDQVGMLRAEMGANWIEARVIQQAEASNARHVIRMTTSDTPEARDTVEDVLSNCEG